MSMLGAIYTGMSGLEAYSQGLRVISNNVANLNTSGFKATDVDFSDMYTFSGTNFGLYDHRNSGGNGVRMDDLQIDFRQGDLRQSENGLDLGIDGAGFFVLLDGDKTFYTRTGNFVVAEDGHIKLEGTEFRLAVLDDAGRAVELNVDSKRTSPPVATTEIKFADNLSSTAIEHVISDIQVYDAAGEAQVWQIEFTRDDEAAGNVWNVTVTNADDREVGTGVLRFEQGEIDPDTAQIVIEDTEAEGLSVTLDFSENITSFSSGTVSTMRSSTVDGYGVGAVTNITTNADGEIELSYSNEETETLGPVALADFKDLQNLESIGDGLFVFNEQGERRLFSSDDPQVGRVLSGRVEASNVDLSAQFGELIIIQRGFQASSQLVSVSNDMIQQLFGIRGQG
ncbi:flagellar hook-basal body complex protein [Sphingorhabdus sp. Alg239-R122]|uniref:flagellar hook protein FlgE n=1 Tax=Sphingorhabdus sp. Alg239-R122 TaxID=2305989 RepID=UPI0013DAD842|nr:flagellar hook-basal body complex protein [Sphingorhabdus sp. Alg239-R122]